MAPRRTIARAREGGATTQPHASNTPAVVPAGGHGDGVAARAYLKWLARGAPQGDAQRDWFEAEAEIRSEAASRAAAE